jgi:hypothetical protein
VDTLLLLVRVAELLETVDELERTDELDSPCCTLELLKLLETVDELERTDELD